MSFFSKWFKKKEKKQEQVVSIVEEKQVEKAAEVKAEITDNADVKIVGFEKETGLYIVSRYNRSFKAKLHQASATIKTYYDTLKNTLLAIKGVKSRISWQNETFNIGRKKLAKFGLRGKTFSVYLALNTDILIEKYKAEDVSHLKKYQDVSLRIRVKNELRLKRCLQKNRCC